ncbi:GNAT family N-acetyltransferase [Hamadaea tsunoensis]|uniref:GNAT family N-acetyltransferase n=1 Tax=Hamadaea tsunoensis TaxID=53368 RepID=UPI00047F528B|nr:GNAT family N-acetyltransferase [Hamadaea tsunoensis]
MRIVAWTPEDLQRRLDEVIEVYGEAMGHHGNDLQARAGRFHSHVRRPDVRGVATLTSEGRLLGFGYGYPGGPGQWWHDQVNSGLTEEGRRRWLAKPFEVVELHVRPTAQGHGLGAQQLAGLLRMATGSTVVLSTPEVPEEQRSRAWRLYRRFGFEDVLRHFIFPGDLRPFAVLGRDLPYT